MDKKNVLFLEGFCRMPWMEDQLADTFISSNHRLTRLSCYERDPKTLNRSFEKASVQKLERELASGEYHAIVVVDLVQDLEIFQNTIGPILQKFVRQGGALAFPSSELTAVTTFTKLFGTQWIPGEYLRTDWVVYEENVEITEATFGQEVWKLEKQQCVALRNVPANEKCFGLTPAERAATPPSLGGGGGQSGEMKQPDKADPKDFDVCVAIHELGKGCIAFFGEGDCQPDTIKLLDAFLTNRSPHTPVDALARLSKSSFEQVLMRKDVGNKHFKKGDFAEAIESYQKAIEIYGFKAGGIGMERHEHANLYANQAECYLRLSDCAKTVEMATKALNLSPDHFKARMRRCKAYLAMARSMKSLRNVEQASEDVSLLNATNEDEKKVVDSLRGQASALENILQTKKTSNFQAGFARAVTGKAM